MLLAEIVATSTAVAATRSRKAKVAALADALRQAGPEELETVVSYLGGTLRQRRTGLGWRGMSELPDPADEPTLTVTDVHAAFDKLSVIAGAGSQATRRAAVTALFARATETEQAWLRGLVTGEVRQGALDALVQEAVAQVADVPLLAVRRSAMLSGSTLAAAVAAFRGGEAALAEFGLEVGRPVLPMLASSAPDIAAAMAKAVRTGPVAIDAKLDGIRIQAHRRGDDILIVTRSLDDITARLPEVVEVVKHLPGGDLVLDGEALMLGPDGRPRPFQETASRTAQSTGAAVVPYFFDLLHLDGHDLLDAPGTERMTALDALVPETNRVRRLVTDDASEAAEFVAETLASGHEGVIVKDPAAAYDA
ncbi:MAG: ATP-dependent DNA ligase, partial [Nocardioides sp.]|uniref:ATP-dependent DNA ligase n=1 Tax=Nocardioides sp. TaxID=35761 RepID=UPI003267ABB1